MTSELDSSTFLLPLSKDEMLVLTAIVMAALTSIDTIQYESQLHKEIMLAKKPVLQSIQNKLTQRR